MHEVGQENRRVVRYGPLSSMGPVGRTLRQDRRSDRVTHDVCVGGLLGMESPHSMFLGSKPKFWSNML